MRRYPTWAPLLAAALVACQTTSPLAHKSTAPSVATGLLSASPAASHAPAVAAATGLLVRPPGEIRELTGTVAVDARYAIGHTAASLIANNGGGVIANNGGGVIANNGGSVIQFGAAAAAVPAGSNLISNNGGALIGDNGGGLLNGTAPFALDAVATAPPEYGTILSGAGLAVGVQDLSTGELLSVGRDAAGHTATALLTDATGAFHLYIPASASGSLRILSAPPTGTDPRLDTALLASQLASNVRLDEESASVADVCRQVLIALIIRHFVPNADQEAQVYAGVTLFDAALVKDMMAGDPPLDAAYVKADVASWSAARQQVLATRLADIVLAGMSLEKVPTLTSLPPPLAPKNPQPDDLGSPATALVAFGDAFGLVRSNVAGVMQREIAAGQDPSTYFAAKSYIQDASTRDHVPYAILKPSDYNDFLIRGIFANAQLDLLTSVLNAITALSDPDIKVPSGDALLLIRANISMLLATARAVYSSPNAAYPAMIKEVQRAAAAPAS